MRTGTRRKGRYTAQYMQLKAWSIAEPATAKARTQEGSLAKRTQVSSTRGKNSFDRIWERTTSLMFQVLKA
jgi:hypothetical protein